MILAKAFTTSGLRLVLRNSSSEETLILSLLRNGLQRGIYCVLRKRVVMRTYYIYSGTCEKIHERIKSTYCLS